MGDEINIPQQLTHTWTVNPVWGELRHWPHKEHLAGTDITNKQGDVMRNTSKEMIAK